MKIVKGKFPWLLANATLFGTLALWLASWKFSEEPSLGPRLYFVAATFVGWFIFLSLKSSVAPNMNGREAFRETQPKTFWLNIAAWSLLGGFFILVGLK